MTSRLVSLLRRILTGASVEPPLRWEAPLRPVAAPLSNVRAMPADPLYDVDEEYARITDEAGFSRWLKGGTS